MQEGSREGEGSQSNGGAGRNEEVPSSVPSIPITIPESPEYLDKLTEELLSRVSNELASTDIAYARTRELIGYAIEHIKKGFNTVALDVRPTVMTFVLEKLGIPYSEGSEQGTDRFIAVFLPDRIVLQVYKIRRFGKSIGEEDNDVVITDPGKRPEIDCSHTGAVRARGKNMYVEVACWAYNRTYHLLGLLDVVSAIDRIIDQSLYIAKVRTRVGDHYVVETVAFDHDVEKFAEGLVSLGITHDKGVVRMLVNALQSRGSSVRYFVSGFIYDPEQSIIRWEPGYVGFEPRKIGVNEFRQGVSDLRKAIDALINPNTFENVEPAYQYLGMSIVYSFYQAYRYIAENADTPVPIPFGYPYANKTTLARAVTRMFPLPPSVTLITEGSHIAQTIPRLAGLMSESTLPVFLDDVHLNDVLVSTILQVGAGTSVSKSIARAKQYPSILFREYRVHYFQARM